MCYCTPEKRTPWCPNCAGTYPSRVELMQAPPAPGRVGDWLLTYTGVAFFPLDPRPEEIRIDDITAGLAKTCRYGGHCIKFESVAEHCVLMAEKAPEADRLDVLMHDAAEAYLGDMVRPLKKSMGDYQRAEARVERAIAERFGLRYPHPPIVKELDNAIIADEREQNMAKPPHPWGPREPLGVTLRFWTPAEASYQFQAAFYRYGGRP